MTMPLRLLLALVLTTAVSGKSVGDDNWPQFRGHGGLGIGSGSPPVKWDVRSGENIAWTIRVPGLGHSAPVIWGNHVFVTTAVNSETETPSVETGWTGVAGETAKDVGTWTWQVISYHIETGKVRWVRDACVGTPAIKRHLKASHANCTPATDGEYVVAFFGSEGLYCYDFEGRLVWKHDLGKLVSGPYDAPTLEWGFSSSPVIHDGHVVVQCDCLNTGFVAILDIKTGKEVRRIDRTGEVATWSTPLVVSTTDRTQIVCNGYRQMAGYDWKTSERIWNLSGGGDVPVPTPLFSDGLIYLTNSHGHSPIYAITATATGNLTPGFNQTVNGLAWWTPRDGSYMPTPLVKGKRLYTCNDNGRLDVRDSLNGDLIYRQRVGTANNTFSASAVAAGGHLYFVSEQGEVTVIEEGAVFKKVATNDLEEIVMATPAISGNRLFIRTARNLHCIAPDRQ